MESYGLVADRRDDVNLLLVGDGPHLAELKRRNNSGRVAFAGRIDHHDLPAIYSASDLLVFPSRTDTFGKVVLEAQACGLPALVSDSGGPQEIIVQGRTGFVARSGNVLDWTAKIEHVLDMMVEVPSQYHRLREDARAHAKENYDWEDILDSIFETCAAPEAGAEKKIA
jgi:glycosyltransferase involved in cell wall biosynthesis